MIEPATEPSTTLYRFYDLEWRLLYVGISWNPHERFKAHAGAKAWWGYVSFIRVDHYATREAALQAETDTIREERPPFNTVSQNRYVREILVGARALARKQDPEGGSALDQTPLCEGCGEPMKGAKPSRKFHSNACRQKGFRARQRESRNGSSPSPKQEGPEDGAGSPIGVAGVARIAGVSKTRAHTLVNREDFPPAFANSEYGRIWLRSDVEVWARRRREELEARRRRMKG